MDMFESSIVVRCLLFLCYCLRQNGQNGSWPDWKKSKRVTFGSSVRFFLDFNGYAIRTTRSIAGYLSNCKLFHCWAILCHDFSIDAGLDGWLALLCFWSVFVLPTCQLCSRCFDEGIDIFVCVCVYTIDHSDQQPILCQEQYLCSTDWLYLSIDTLLTHTLQMTYNWNNSSTIVRRTQIKASQCFPALIVDHWWQRRRRNAVSFYVQDFPHCAIVTIS